MSKSREQLDSWLKEIEISGGCVLDVGVQDKPVHRRLKSMDVDCYKTLDVDEQWLPDILTDLNEPILPELINQYDSNFDHVFMLEVIEHLWNPIFALKQINMMMKTQGKIYMSWPFINPMHDYFDFARYTKEGMMKLLETANFRTIEVRYRYATSGRSQLLEFYSKEYMRVSKIRPAEDHINKHIIGYMLIAEKL